MVGAVILRWGNVFVYLSTVLPWVPELHQQIATVQYLLYLNSARCSGNVPFLTAALGNFGGSEFSQDLIITKIVTTGFFNACTLLRSRWFWPMLLITRLLSLAQTWVGGRHFTCSSASRLVDTQSTRLVHSEKLSSLRSLDDC